MVRTTGRILSKTAMPASSDETRVLVLTSATGGGHNARARAFEKWAKHLTDWEVRIHDPLQETHALYHFGAELYNWIQRTYPALHHIYFQFLEHVGTLKSPGRMLGSHRFVSLLETYRPNIVLSTHDHLNHGFFALARDTLGAVNVRCVTYCGELSGGYGFSRHWINPAADLFVGAVEETTATAIKLGMDVEKAWTGGFLLDPDFYRAPDTFADKNAFIQQELGMDPSAFILLLATGGAGANNHLPILNCLERRGRPVQVVVLCGRDEKLYEKISRWSRRASAVKAQPLRFWSRMPLLLQSVSAVVARPGTGTTSEAILSGCPLILNGIGGVMPQEQLTVRFALQNGIVRLIKRPRDVAGVLDDWFSDGAELKRLRANMDRVRPTGHPSDITARITALT